MTNDRYYLRDGAIYDRELLRTLSLNEIVDLLNKFEEIEFKRFINGGW